ncbi:hypothetical protein ACFWA6_35860 [Streptomyces sp. NPDC060020]|uniref:hypothetical protein n=1 Tax=unclassified Streptomyces TaxID=2593676 RepID=UPI0036808A15
MKRLGAGGALTSPAAVAGWLFADMLLVFALVALGSQPDHPVDRTEAAPAQSPTPLSTTDAKQSGPRAVEKKPVELSVSGSPDNREALISQIRAATAEHQGREAAIVLTFGRGGNADAGQAYAHSVNQLLAVARPEMFPQTTTRDFHYLSGPSGTAEVEIYFFTPTT